jgi:hypothetical protein
MHDGKHLCLIAFDLVETDLVDLCGRLIQGGGLADAEGVVGFAVGQGRDAGVGAAVRNIGDSEEIALRTSSVMRLRSGAEMEAGNFLSGRENGLSAGF